MIKNGSMFISKKKKKKKKKNNLLNCLLLHINSECLNLSCVNQLKIFLNQKMNKKKQQI